MNKIIFVVLFMCSQQVILVAQNSFSEQYDYAKKLYEQEKYFDAVTEFKRLLFFAKDNSYDYDANFLIGLSFLNDSNPNRESGVEYLKVAERLGSKKANELLKELEVQKH